jgi:large subunit ribosomal protein L4
MESLKKKTPEYSILNIMAQVPVYNSEGKEIEKLELSDAVFGVKVKEHVVAEAMHAQRAAGRPVLAHVKERGEVRGGGRKPWRQKGTGRARHGSIRSPLWRGGGVTFGPRKNRSYGKKINAKVRKSALRMVLTDKAKSGLFIVLDALPNDGKTKTVAAARKALPGSGRKVLIVMDVKDDAAIRAFSNLPKTDVISAKSLNVLDLLNHQYVLVPKRAVKVIEKVYG